MKIDTLYKAQTRKKTPYSGRTKTNNGVNGSTLFRFCNIGSYATSIEFVFRLTEHLCTAILADTI